MAPKRGAIGAAILVFLGALLAPRPVAAATEPTISASVASAAPGAKIIVTLSGWTAPTNVSVCGNDGLRGAPDCDLRGTVGFAASGAHDQSSAMIIGLPPAPCPCVLRASLPGEQIVRTIPFEVVGAPVGPLVRPDTAASADTLKVAARIIEGDQTAFDALRSGLGGATSRVLVLTLTNTGTDPLGGITLTAAVGRNAQGGEPLPIPNIEPLAPGETRPYSIPVEISAPAFGSYVVSGTVYGPGEPVSFHVTTKTTPWLLAILIVVLLVDVVAIAVLRIRRRRRAGATPPQGGEAPAAGAPFAIALEPASNGNGVARSGTAVEPPANAR